MDDDEIQVIEVTVHSGSPKRRKRRRKESLPQPPSSSTQTPNNDIVYKAAQLKRRLAFCETEQQELAKRFKEIKEQLTKEQSCALDVKVEDSDKHVPLICVGDNSDDDEVVFILPEDYSPLKRRKLDDETKAEKVNNNADQPKKDVAITYFKPATNLPHAREHCAVHKFVQSNVTTATVSCNESYCEQCYCYVCDASVKECDSWKTGTNPHCNGYAKNAFWEKLRKMLKRKTSAVQDSLLKCLPVDEQTESLKTAAAKVTELLETLKGELNDSSNNFNSRPSSPSCDCECHYESDDSYGGYSRLDGCDMCCDEHDSMCAYDWPFNCYGRWAFSLSDNVSNTVSKATDYLKSEQPDQAAVVLDALTVLLLAADNDRNRWPSGQVSFALRSLRKAWIEVLMHPDLPKNVEDKVRERLKNAIDGALICSPESTGLKVILEMKMWSDESLVNCLAGKLGDDFITEDEEVAEARIAFLEKNKRFSDALSYMLGCKVTQKNRSFNYIYYASLDSSSEQILANISSYRNKFILFLIKTGKIDQVLQVITLPHSAKLTKDVLTKTTSKAGNKVDYSHSALGSMSYYSMKELLSAIVSDNSSSDTGKLPSPQIIPEEKLKKVLALILTGAQVNSSLRSETAMEWYIDTFCESSFFNNLTKDVSQKFNKEAEQVVNKAKNKLLSPSEIKPPFKGPFKVFVVELFAALTVSVFVNTALYRTYSITSTLEVFKKKELRWACVSMMLSTTLANKITPQILDFVLDNLLKPFGSSCIPSAVYERWIIKLPNLNGIEKNYEIVQHIHNKREKTSGTQALHLVKKLIEAIEAMFSKSSNWDKIRVSKLIKKIKSEFKFASKDVEFWQMECLLVKNDPSYSKMFVVQVNCPKGMWPQLKSSMIDFLKTHRTSHTEACIEVFAKYAMYDEVKLTLAARAYSSSYPSICDQITKTLLDLQNRKKLLSDIECRAYEEPCKFADACVDWLGKTLCDNAFHMWRHSYINSSIPEALLKCIKAMRKAKRQSFNDILSTSLQKVAIVFCNNTVSHRHRMDLERWLKDIKALYFKKKEETAWSWAFHELTTGQLRRKPAVTKHLKCSTFLLTGTVPYVRLVKMQVASNAATNTTCAKPAQSDNMAASTPSNTSSVKPVQGTPSSSQSARVVLTPKQPVNIVASTSSNIPKPAQSFSTSVQKSGNRV